MTTAINECAWPFSRLGDAIEALALKSGLSASPAAVRQPPRGLASADNHALGRWVEAAAGTLGVEVESAVERYPKLDRFLRAAGPAVLRISDGAESRFLCLLGGRGRALRVLAPDSAVRRVSLDAVNEALCGPREAPLTTGVDRLLREAGVPAARVPLARAAVLRERLADEEFGGCWQFGLPPGASFWRQLTHQRFPRRLGALIALHALQYALWIVSWWMVGKGALEGRLDPGWLAAWALILLTLVPMRLLVTWWQGVLAVGAGALLKRRLLVGALSLEPERIRHEGAGQLLGRVIEVEAVESLALSGGFTGLVAVVELALAAAVLGLSDGGGLHALLLVLWIGVTGIAAWRYFLHRRAWTQGRLGMTHDLVERMVGHRTRLAQESPHRWHDGEDQALDRYYQLSRALDSAAARMVVLIPRGWLVVGLAALTPIFVFGRGSPAALAVCLGGIILAYRGFERLVAGVSHLAGAIIAWKQVSPFFHVTSQTQRGSPDRGAPVATGTRRSEDLLMEGHDLVFRYRGRPEPVLRGCTLRLQSGDRVLLEGPSGGGKSTLASLLSGLRSPESGLLLLDGLDRHTLGESGWRRRVAAAPQYHENHVLTSTLAFNLLMSRRWPPGAGDMDEAEALCRELGLGPLLDRMPAGLLQMVGETGWQLSQGERSRLFMARALLQGADLVVLDESFAALDPETLALSLKCALNRVRTLLVVAHP